MGLGKEEVGSWELGAACGGEGGESAECFEGWDGDRGVGVLRELGVRRRLTDRADGRQLSKTLYRTHPAEVARWEYIMTRERSRYPRYYEPWILTVIAILSGVVGQVDDSIANQHETEVQTLILQATALDVY